VGSRGRPGTAPAPKPPAEEEAADDRQDLARITREVDAEAYVESSGTSAVKEYLETPINLGA
jgi:hypothetical protein